MRIRTPYSSVRNWFVSYGFQSVALLVAALCLAFTEWQTPPVSQTVPTGNVPEVAFNLAGLHADHGAALAILGDGASREPVRGFGTTDSCGVCWDHEDVHLAVPFPEDKPASGFGPSQHGWHSEWREGLPCDFSHGICVFVPRGGSRYAETRASEVTDAVVRAAAAADAPLLAVLLTLPDVHANLDRTAIQVAGCDGTIIAGHVPVPGDLLEEAQAASDRSAELAIAAADRPWMLRALRFSARDRSSPPQLSPNSRKTTNDDTPRGCLVLAGR